MQLIVRRDKQFSEELLARFNKKNEENAADEKNSTFDPTEPDLATVRRLELALYLLENGETEKALAIADTALRRATTQGIIFLIALRKKMPAVADARFSNLLAQSRIDPTSDATSVSLLSSYAFTPTILVTMTQNGTISRQLGENTDTVSTGPDKLKLDFLQTALQIFLRPLPPIEQDNTSAGRNGLFFTITRLLPLFEQYLPDKVPLLRNQIDLIAQNISNESRAKTDYFARAGFSSEDSRERRLDDVLREIKSSSSSGKQTDDLYAHAARLAATKNDLRARELAEKISDANLKDRVLAFVDFTLIHKLIEKKDADKALTLLEKAKLPTLQRVWFMTEIARLFGKVHEFDARRLLEQAATEVRKVGTDESWKANALSAIAVAYLPIDSWASWRLANDAVKAANNAATDEELNLSAKLQTGGSVSMVRLKPQGLDIANLFVNIAPYNLYQAASLAETLNNEYQRATSLLAVASSEIKPKNNFK